MKKQYPFQIKFDKDYIKTLLSDENSGVHKKNCRYHIALHPSQFGKFGQSLKEELSLKIAKYDESFSGVMLSFENIEVESDLGIIGLDNCFIHLDVNADFFIFTPEVGKILRGIVTKTSTDHVGCLLYKMFNVSLPKSECPEDTWIGSEVNVGNEIEFKITFVDLESRLVYIRGQLLSITSKNQAPDFLNMFQTKKVFNKKVIFNEESEDKTPKQKKANKKTLTKDSDTSQDNLVSIEIQNSDQQLTKTKKKKKREDNQEDVASEMTEYESREGLKSPKEKKAKKKRKNSENESTQEYLTFLEPIENQLSETKKSKKKRKIEENEAIQEEEEVPNKKVKLSKKEKKQQMHSDEEEVTKKRDKRKKKKMNQENTEDEVLLDELDLKSLFQDRSIDLRDSIGTMANKEDSKKRKHSQDIKVEVM